MSFPTTTNNTYLNCFERVSELKYSRLDFFLYMQSFKTDIIKEITRAANSNSHYHVLHRLI